MYRIHTHPKTKDVRSRADLYAKSSEHKRVGDMSGVLQTFPELSFDKQYVVVQKSGTEPAKEFIIHFRQGCPNTARALGAIDRMPNGCRVHMLSADDSRTNKKLRKYLKKNYPDVQVTYPRVFDESGELIGGATELIEHLKETR